MYTRSVTVCHATKRVPSADLVQKGRLHVQMMTNNPAFPDPIPSLNEISKACDELDVASQVYELNKGRIDKVTRDTARERLRRLIICLAGYVQGHCKNQVQLVHSAGFEAKRKRSPSKQVESPISIRARATPNTNRIDLRWTGVKGNRLYTVWISQNDPTDDTAWKELGTTTRNYLSAMDLERFRTYSFRVSAWGVLGKSPLSSIAVATAA